MMGGNDFLQQVNRATREIEDWKNAANEKDKIIQGLRRDLALSRDDFSKQQALCRELETQLYSCGQQLLLAEQANRLQQEGRRHMQQQLDEVREREEKSQHTREQQQEQLNTAAETYAALTIAVRKALKKKREEQQQKKKQDGAENDDDHHDNLVREEEERRLRDAMDTMAVKNHGLQTELEALRKRIRRDESLVQEARQVAQWADSIETLWSQQAQLANTLLEKASVQERVPTKLFPEQ